MTTLRRDRVDARNRERIMQFAEKFRQAVGGGRPKSIGEFRYTDSNESCTVATMSPEGVRVVCLLSMFRKGDTALNFFSSESLSTFDKFENIGNFNYDGIGPSDLRDMVKDLKWVWKTVDEYQESWTDGD